MKNKILNEIMDNVSYDINGVFDNSFEEENKFINDLEKLIENNSDKAKILINIISHYLIQYDLELDYEIFSKGVIRNE